MNTQVRVMDQNLNASKSKYLIFPWVITFLSSLFLFYKYIMQVSPSVMTSQLMHTFQINALGLGVLASTFFGTYLITQLFVGVLLDRLNPRFLSSCAILTSAVGTLLFAESKHLSAAIVSRGLMGVGAAFATVSYMKLTANWFRPERFALVGGLLATAAMLGGVAGQGLNWLVAAYGWRYTLIICGWFGIAIAFVFMAVVRDKPKVAISPYADKANYSFTFRDLGTILSKSQNWLLTFYSGLAFSPVAVLGSLWGNPFFEEAYKITPKQGSTLIMMMFFGLAAGGPLLGFASDYLRNRRGIMLAGAVLSLVTITVSIYVSHLPIPLLKVLLFMFGFGTGAFMLGFAIGKEINPIAYAATVVALVNSGDAIFGWVTEPLIGKFLDLKWSGVIKNGIHYFSVTEYKFAFLIIPAYLLVATILVLFIKETKGVQQYH